MAVSFGVGRRFVLALAWLWLWCRLAAAALIRPVAWELPYATCAALKKNPLHTVWNPKLLNVLGSIYIWLMLE